MPIFINKNKTGTGKLYANPFVGEAEYPAQIAVNISALTADEIDTYGFLKPGIPLNKAGALVGAGPDYVYGVTPEPLDVLHLFYGGPDWATRLAAVGSIQLNVITIGQVNRGIIEDNLGRVLTANELAGFTAAGSKIVLLG